MAVFARVERRYASVPTRFPLLALFELGLFIGDVLARDEKFGCALKPVIGLACSLAPR